MHSRIRVIIPPGANVLVSPGHRVERNMPLLTIPEKTQSAVHLDGLGAFSLQHSQLPHFHDHTSHSRSLVGETILRSPLSTSVVGIDDEIGELIIESMDVELPVSSPVRGTITMVTETHIEIEFKGLHVEGTGGSGEVVGPLAFRSETSLLQTTREVKGTIVVMEHVDHDIVKTIRSLGAVGLVTATKLGPVALAHLVTNAEAMSVMIRYDGYPAYLHGANRSLYISRKRAAKGSAKL